MGIKYDELMALVNEDPEVSENWGLLQWIGMEERVKDVAVLHLVRGHFCIFGVIGESTLLCTY